MVNPNTKHRPGRPPLLDAAADMFSEAVLADVAGFVGPRSVARRVGVSVGTISHHFPNGAADLQLAALQRALERVGATPIALMAGSVEEAGTQLSRLGQIALDQIGSALIRELQTYSPEDPSSDTRSEASETAGLLAAAVAPRDKSAAKALRVVSDEHHRITVDISMRILELTGRRWNEDVTADDFATTINSLANGTLLARRIGPDRASLDLYAEMVMRIFESCTSPKVMPDSADYRGAILESAGGSNLDPEKRESIISAVGRIYERKGWLGLNTVAIAKEAGVSRPTVVANFYDRNGLAAAVWARHMPALRKAAEHDLPLPLHVAIHANLERLAAAARVDMELTSAFLEGVFAYTASHGPPDPNDPADPRNLVPLPPLLVPAIERGAALLRPGNADTPEQVIDTASMLANHTLHLTTTRPALVPSDVATRICDTTLAGMLKERVVA